MSLTRLALTLRTIPITFGCLLGGCETDTEPDTDTAVSAATIDPAAVSEVDLVHLGGTTEGATTAMAVSVGATGNGGRLTSWKVAPGVAPLALADSAIIAGKDHQLHVLTPYLWTSTRQTLVTASISGGSLTIRTWSIPANGVFAQLAQNTYNTIGVVNYAMAHRELTNSTAKTFQLVIPIVHAGALRLATYEINATTGAITVRADSTDLVFGAAADPQLSISYVRGNARVRPHYAVSFVDIVGRIRTSTWRVDDAGVPVLHGAYTSGKDIANAAGVVRNATTLASAPLTDSGFITVGNVPATQSMDATNAEVQVWEDYTCAGANCIVPLNITDSSRDTVPAVFGVQQAVAPVITAPRAVSHDPTWNLDDLFPPQSPDTIQSIASVRKAMVLIVMLDAVRAGAVSFDDPVVVSAAAANHSGSTMNLEKGEIMTLRDLAYGMMIDSAGDATWAISEHVAGNLNAFVARMNAKATELGLTNTIYCHDAADAGFSSVGYSSARDQARLWGNVYDDPDFIEIAGRASANVCGTLEDGTQKCHPLSKSMTWYLELDGHKPGANGGSCAAYSGIYSTCSGCLTAQATRLDRSVVTTTLSTAGSSTRPDATIMFDYSFRQIFTPDYRGSSGVQAGNATDFGLDSVADDYVLTAVPAPGSAVKVCNWNVSAGMGVLTRTQCTTRGLAGLTPAAGAIPKRLGIAKLSEIEAEADYVFGRITAGALQLKLWRVGQKDF